MAGRPTRIVLWHIAVFGGLAGLVFLGAVGTSAQSTGGLPDLGGAVRLRVGGESTRLDPRTRELRTRLTLEVLNTSGRALLAPFHVVVTPSDPTVVVDGADGGPGADPYQSYYLDLSSDLPEGFLPPGGAVERTVEFARSTRTFLRYSLRAVGVLNQPPEIRDGGPYQVTLGDPVLFNASASFDPEGEPLAFRWAFGDGDEAVGPAATHVYAETGVFVAHLTATDSFGDEVDQEIRVLVRPSEEFALARSRTLDGAGLPLAGVVVEESGPAGERTFASEPSGFLSAGQGAGSHRWRLSAPGYLAVHREAILVENEVVQIPHPWLARRVGEFTADLSPIRVGSFASADGSLRGTTVMNQVADVGLLTLTPLHAQTLPGRLPFGFSPLQAFWLETTTAFRLPLALEADLWDPLASGETGWLLEWESSSFQWRVESALVGSGRTASMGIPRGGVWCIAVADPGAPIPQPGQPLSGEVLTNPDLATFTAEASASPGQRAAGLVAAAVTTTARVDFTHPTTLQSGHPFPVTVAETYALSGGRFRTAPAYDSTVVAYRRPGLASADTLRAVFPLRPQFLFSAPELDEALVHVEVLANSPISQGVLDGSGGILQAGELTLSVPTGLLSGVSVVEVRSLDPQRIAEESPDLTPQTAFELNLARAASGMAIGVEIAGLTPNQDWILARVIARPDHLVLEPALRMMSDAAGIARSVEPVSEPRLPGVTGSGQFVLLRSHEPLALVFGTVSVPAGNPEGVVVTTVGTPWGSEVDSRGTFRVLAVPTQATVVAKDPATAQEAEGTVSGLDPASPAELSLGLGPVGPRVTRLVPESGAERVIPSIPITIGFSEAVNPATVLTGGVLLEDAANQAVAASLSLSLDGRTVTLLPVEPLRAATTYALRVAPSVEDLQGLLLEGENEFVFTTAPLAPRGAGAELVIYEPGATNCPCATRVPGYDPSLGDIVCVEGGPGTADPGVAVILVNESDGRTATVVAEEDGSFLNFVEAVEGDFVSATFVNANGTRITIPVTRQLFDDGRVGLYRAGGILETESDGGPVQVFVEPGAIEERTRFRLEAFPLDELLALLDNTEPDGGQLLAAAHYREDLAAITEAADISFPIDPADLDFPSDLSPEEATYLLTSPVRIGEDVVYQVLDTMAFEDDGQGGARVTTQSPPFVGLLARQVKAMRKSGTRVNTITPVRQIDAGDEDIAPPEIDTVVGPVAAPVRSDTVIAGRVLAGPVDEDGEVVGDLQPIAGALVGLEFVGDLPRQPGEFKRGELVYLSDDDGRYAFFLNAEDAKRRLTATHPRFPFQVARSAGFQESQDGSIVQADLIFGIPTFENEDLADVAAPVLSVSHTPTLPGLGEEILLTVAAADDGELGPVEVAVESATTLVEGLDVSGDVQVEPAGVERPSAGRLVETFAVGIQLGARIRLRVSVSDAAGHTAEVFHGLVVGGDRVVFSGDDVDDDRGPVVLRSWPPGGSRNVPSLMPVVLRFNEPIEPNVFENKLWKNWVSMANHTVYQVIPNDAYREATVFYTGPADGEVQLSVSAPLADENGNELDQEPLEPGAQGFDMTFRQAGPVEAQIDEIAQGGGVTLFGRFAYALDRTSDGEGRLLSYDLEEPADPEEIHDLSLDARPTTLAAVPAYALADDVTVVSGFPTEQTCRQVNLLAVFTGGANQDKRLSLISAEAGRLTEEVSGPISISPASSVVKSKWDPPFLGFFELGADVTSVGLINLQAFHTGYSLDEEQREQLPETPFAGIDANLDGDYCDTEFSEFPALPAGSEGTFGLEFSFAPADPTDRIADVDFSADYGLLGIVTTKRGVDNGAFHTILGGNAAIPLDGARVDFDPGERPRRMLLIPNLVVDEDPQPSLRDLALVTLSTPEPVLAVIDITIPELPAIVNRIDLPAELGDAFSMVRRSDGQVALAMTRGTVLVDPFRVLAVGGDGVHPAVTGQVPGVGGGVRDFVSDPSGLNLTTSGGRLDLVQTAPGIRFVNLPEPLQTAEQLAELSVAEKRALLRRTRPAGAGDPLSLLVDTAADLPDPDPFRHYYVHLEAPGGAGEELDLALVAADARGRAVQPINTQSLPKMLMDLSKGVEGLLLSRAYINVSVIQVLETAGLETAKDFKDPASALKILNLPSVADKLKDIVGALLKYPDTIQAYRLSSDPGDALYNHYLAGPLVLLPDDVDGDVSGTLTLPGDSRLKDLQGQLHRVYLQASPLAWAGISPAEKGNSVVGRFASTARVQDQFFEVKGVGLGSDILKFVREAGEALPKELEKLVEENASPEKIQKAVEDGLPGLVDGALEELKLKPQMVIHATPGAHALLPVNVRTRNPVIVIPGTMGSHLQAREAEDPSLAFVQELLDEVPKLDSFVNTGAIQNLWLEGALFGTDRLELTPGGRSLNEVAASDLIRHLPTENHNVLSIAGEVPDSLRLDIYAPLIKRLELAGYVEYDYRTPFDDLFDRRKAFRLEGEDAEPNLGQDPTPDLFVFPYDWRLSNIDSALALRDYVDLVFALHPEAEQVDIVAHSMGGLVAGLYIRENPGVVDQCITVGTPWLGAPKALAALETGDFDDLVLNFLVPPKQLRRLAQYMRSLHELLPSRGLFELGFSPVVETGWDANGNGVFEETYDFDAFLDLLRNHLLLDNLEEFYGDEAPAQSPSADNHLAFHGGGGDSGFFGDWSDDTSGVEFHHFFGMQAAPHTITRVALDTWLTPVALTNEVVVLGGTSVDFFDSEQDGAERDRPVYDDGVLPLGTEQYQLQRSMRYTYGTGDGTVPLHSAARGAGSANDLNAPHARLYPVLEPQDLTPSDRNAEHNGMLGDETLLQQVVEILDGRIPETLTVNLGVNGRPEEGSQAAVTVSVSGLATPVLGSAVVDFGDGTTSSFAFGIGQSSKSITHTYLDDGEYTLSCGVAYDNGQSGFASTTVSVENVDPEVTILGDTGDPELSANLYTAAIQDPGFHDQHRFVWAAPGVVIDATNRFLTVAEFPTSETYVVSVRVEDGDGGVGEAETTVSITETGAVDVVDLTDPVGLDGAAAANPARQLLIRVDGADPKPLVPDGVQVLQRASGALVFGVDLFGAASLIDLARQVMGNALQPGYEGGSNVDADTVFLNIVRPNHRDPANGDRINYESAQVTVNVSGASQLHAVYLEDGLAMRADIFEVGGSTVTGSSEQAVSSVVYEFDWTKAVGNFRINGETEAAPASMVHSVTNGLSANDRSAPEVIGVENEWNDRVYLAGRDNVTAERDLEYFVGFDADLDGDFTGEVFFPLIEREFEESSFPAHRAAVIARDEMGNVTPPRPFEIEEVRDYHFAYRVDDQSARNGSGGDPTDPDDEDYCTELGRIRVAVRSAITNALIHSAMEAMLLDRSHLWILEQGSGACLWSEDCRACEHVGYKPGESDNDFEVLLPNLLVMDPASPDAGLPAFDPADPADRERFLAMDIHSDAVMSPRHWYFDRPVGLDADKNPTSDPVERAFWRYTLPPQRNGSPVTHLDRLAIFVSPTIDNIGVGSANPLTPAEIVSFVLTETVRTDPALRELLPDVNFFPFRREHFMYGAMSLERPPEFGDDPVGDAGMGRGLLLLKWLIEGAYPDVPGLDEGPPLAGVYSNLVSHGISSAEGFEWAVLQEYAWEAAEARLDVTMEPVSDSTFSLLLEEFPDKRRRKVLRKSGKAALRAGIGQVVGIPATQTMLLPDSLADARAAGSFEAHIRDVLAQVPVAGIGNETLREFLLAKRGNDELFDGLHAGDYEILTLSSSDLIERSQSATHGQYRSYLESGPGADGPTEAEILRRCDNMRILLERLGSEKQGELIAPLVLSLMNFSDRTEILDLSLTLGEGTQRERPSLAPYTTAVFVGEASALGSDTPFLIRRERDPSGVAIGTLSVSPQIPEQPLPSPRLQDWEIRADVFPKTLDAEEFDEAAAMNDLLMVKLFLDPDFTQPVTDHPAADGRPRSPRHLLTKTDRLYLRVLNCGNAPLGRVRARFRTEGGAESDLFDLEEVAEGVYANRTSPLRVDSFFDARAGIISLIDEDVVAFDVEAESGATASLDLMLDRAEFAAGGLEFMYAGNPTSADDIIPPNAREPMIDSMIATGNFWLTGDRTFPFRMGATPIPNDLTDFIQNAGAFEVGDNESDFFVFVSHGQDDGSLYDHPQNPTLDKLLIFDPDDPDHGIDNVLHWNTDVDWVLTPICNTLDPLGTQAWVHVMQAADRPIHMVLGGHQEVGPDANARFVYFSELALGQGMPILDAYRVSMETSSNRFLFAGEPWAALVYESARHETLRERSPDPRPGDRILYFRGEVSGGHDCRDTDPSTTDRSVGRSRHAEHRMVAALDDGVGVLLFDWNSVRGPTEPVRPRVELRPWLSAAAPPGWRRYVLHDATIGFDNRLRGDTAPITSLDADAAETVVRRFVSQHWPETFLYAEASGIDRHTLAVAQGRGAGREWTSGYRVEFPVAVDGIPVLGHSLTAYIEGDRLTSCYLRDVEEVWNIATERVSVLRPAEAWAHAFHGIGQSVSLDNSYAIADAQLLYVEAPNSSGPYDRSARCCVPAWQFAIYPSFKGDSHGPEVRAWVDAVTGEFLYALGEGAP